MPLQYPAHKSLGSRQVAPLTKPELDSVTIAVDDMTEVFPLALDFDVSLVQVPSPADESLASIETLKKLR